MSEILEHLDGHLFVLAEVKRVLKKGGKLIVTVPNVESIKRIFDSPRKVRCAMNSDEFGEHICGFGAIELVNLLKLAGFKVLTLRKICCSVGKLGINFPDTKLFSPLASHILTMAVKNL